MSHIHITNRLRMGKYHGDVKARVKAHTLGLCASRFASKAQRLESKHFRCHAGGPAGGEIVATWH